MAATQEQVTALNVALTQSQEHTAQLSQQIDQVKADSITALKLAEKDKAELTGVIDRLRQEADNVTRELRVRIQAMEGTRGGRGQGLIDAKSFSPKLFSGKDDEHFKAWAKQVRAYSNARKRGFRTILEWAEEQKMPIDDVDLASLQWEPAVESDVEFYEYLCMVTADEALLLVEKFKNHGFEAWRQLHRRFNPTGGRFEVSRMNSLLSRKQCKTLAEVPAAVDMLERDFANYEARSPHAFPTEWKIPLLLQLLPDKAREELEFKFSMGEKDYGKMVANIVGYTNDHRVSRQRAKNPNDMDVDSMTPGEYSQADWQQHLEDMENYYEAELSYMGKSGKSGKGGKWGKGGYYGKGYGNPGKGDRGKGDKGKGKGDSNKGQAETRTCHWCKKPGHLKKDCRRFHAGKPKVPEAHDAKSLDQPDWEEDDEDASQLDEEAMAMDQESDTGSDDSDADFVTTDEEDTPEPASTTSTSVTVGAGKAVRTPPVRTASTWSPPSTSTTTGTRRESQTEKIGTIGTGSTGESQTEKILREQREVNRKILAATPPPPGLLGEVVYEIIEDQLPGVLGAWKVPTDEATLAETPPKADCKVINKNRNKSAKKKLRKKLITVLDEVDEVTEKTHEALPGIIATGTPGSTSTTTDEKGDAKSLEKVGARLTAAKSTSSSPTLSTSSSPTLRRNALYAVEQIKNTQDVEDRNTTTTAAVQSSRLTRSAATAQASVRVPFWPDQPGPRRTVAPSYGLVSPEPQSTICATPEHMEPAYEYAKDKNDLPNPSRPRTSEAEVQTAVSLRSTQLDVIWTASILETVVDSPEMEDATEDEEVIDDETSTVCADVGERADMLDSIEQESQELDCMNVLMNIYIHMMAVIMIVMFASAHEDHRVKDGSDEEDGDINVVVENDDVKMWRTPKASKGPQRRRMKLRKGITVDSGAHSNVMPKRMIRDQSKIRPSPGSKRGAHFVAANNGRIANEGEIDFVFKTAEGHERSFVFQVAETNKPLGAASYFVDDGFRVVFDKDMKTGVDLSMMLNKATGEITRFRRVRNIWVMDATIEEEILPHECPFHRQA